MADFKVALQKVLKHEGGYVNHANDKGGETIFGVARNAWKNLSLWKEVDNYKKAIDFTNTKQKRAELETLCKGNANFMESLELFYKSNFWDKIKGDEITCQSVAEIYFDFAVNSGVKTASKKIQTLLGVTPDGIVGNATISALNARGEEFCKEIYKERAKFYDRLVENNPSQKVFLKGWINRIDSYNV